MLIVAFIMTYNDINYVIMTYNDNNNKTKSL